MLNDLSVNRDNHTLNIQATPRHLLRSLALLPQINQGPHRVYGGSALPNTVEVLELAAGVGDFAVVRRGWWYGLRVSGWNCTETRLAWDVGMVDPLLQLQLFFLHPSIERSKWSQSVGFLGRGQGQGRGVSRRREGLVWVYGTLVCVVAARTVCPHLI